jgi:hypothetical protein
VGSEGMKEEWEWVKGWRVWKESKRELRMDRTKRGI